MENAQRTIGDGSRIFIGIHAVSGCLAADQSHAFIRNKIIKCSHGIASASHAGHNGTGKLSFLFQDLLFRLFADDALEVTHDHRKRMRPHYRAEHIQGVIHPVRPLPHGFVYGIL